MTVRAAEGSEDGTQWQYTVAVVEGGGALEAVMRLRNTEAADDRQGVVYNARCFGPERVRPQKAGNGC